MEALRNTHNRLAEHFALKRMADQDAVASTYFADHGLTADEYESLRSLVHDGLLCKSLESFDWSSAYLPLLVCAVEVGYDYEGNGTDFWPTLEQSLGRPFGFNDRERLSNWFAKASACYGGVTPGDSDWEKAFCHIAWPITHAVAAKDIRRPFADCLRRFDGRLEGSNEAIAKALASVNTPIGSRRFRSWLGRHDVVAAIVRYLFDCSNEEDETVFTPGFRHRLIEDLRNEPEIRSAVRSVETRQKTQAKRKSTKAAKEAVASDEVRFGDFFLKQDEQGCYALYGELPVMPKEVQRELKTVRRRWQPRPWGYSGAAALPSDVLRSARGTFPIEITYVSRASEVEPFFKELDELSLSDESQEWLSSVRFHAWDRLAFRPMEGDDDCCHAITSPTPHRGTVWVLAKKSVEWPDVERKLIAKVDGGEIHEVDATNASLREWLNWPAANTNVRLEAVPFVWLRPTPVSTDAAGQAVYTTDDEIGISAKDGRTVELVLRLGRKDIECLQVDAIALVSLETSGSYELLVRENGVELDSFAFEIADDKGDGFIEPDPESPWHAILSHVDAGETTLTRTDLFNRRLALDIVGDRGIENLTALISISPGSVAKKVRLDRIPARLGPSHPIWNGLIQQLPSSVVGSSCDLTIQVNIASSPNDTWLLEADVLNLWWESGADGLPVAMSDEGELAVKHYCVITGNCITKATEGDPFVCVAIGTDGSELTFDARIGISGDALLKRELHEPRRLLRQMDDVGDIPGLCRIAHRYLQLSAGSSSSLTAEFNRVGAAQTIREWILQSVCGPNWVKKRQEMSSIERANPIAVWWESQLNHPGLVLPLVDEPRKLPGTLPVPNLSEFANVLPPAWWDGAVSEVTANETDPINAVYSHLLDEDVYVDAIDLTKSLCEANERLCGSHLADLMIPVTGGDEILTWQLSEMSIDEASDALLQWSKRFLQRGRGRQTWTRDELQDWLNFLLYPERLRQRSWQTVLEKLLQDRPMARAGAFVAWRFEQSKRIDGMLTQVTQL